MDGKRRMMGRICLQPRFSRVEGLKKRKENNFLGCTKQFSFSAAVRNTSGCDKPSKSVNHSSVMGTLVKEHCERCFITQTDTSPSHLINKYEQT